MAGLLCQADLFSARVAGVTERNRLAGRLAIILLLLLISGQVLSSLIVTD